MPTTMIGAGIAGMSCAVALRNATPSTARRNRPHGRSCEETCTARGFIHAGSGEPLRNPWFLATPQQATDAGIF